MVDDRLLPQVIAPVILAGISNMVFVKAAVLQSLKRPMDGGRAASDGKRLFGDNKTWKGFIGMVVLTALWATVGNQLCSLMGWPAWDQTATAALFGALLGLAYVVFELPNSYIKRRIDIAPGRNGAGPIGLLFILIDQVDSVLGCLLVASWWFDVRWGDVFAIIAICGGVHLVINQLLFLVGLKRQRY